MKEVKQQQLHDLEIGSQVKKESQVRKPKKNEDQLVEIEVTMQDVVFVCQSSIPYILSFLGFALLITINLHFTQFTNNLLDQSVIGLSTVIMNSTFGCTITGMNQGINTYVARAFGAKKQKRMLEFLTMGIRNLFLLLILLLAFVIFVSQILIFLGQDPILSELCGYYLKNTFIALMTFYIFDCFRNFLNAIHIFIQPSYILLACLAFQFLFCYIYQKYAQINLGVIAIATNLSNVISVLLIILLVAKKGYSKLLGQLLDVSWLFNKTELVKILQFGKKLMAFALPVFVDSFSFEINSLLLGTYPDHAHFNAHIALANLFFILYCCPLGITCVVSTLISNSIGEKNIQKLLKYEKISQYLTLSLGVFTIVILSLFEEEITSFYAQGETKQLMKSVLRLQPCIMLDYMQACYTGIMKGLGKPEIVARGYIYTYYVFGVPMGYFLGFYLNLGVLGYWMAFFSTWIALLFYLIYQRSITHLEDLIKNDNLLGNSNQ